MLSLTKRFCLVAICGLAGFTLNLEEALGQNPYFQVRPGLTLQQYTYNLATVGNTLARVQANSLGYRAAALGSTASPYAGAYANPYASAAMYSNGYSAGLYSSPYSNPYMYGNPYYNDPYGGYLRGGADVINSQGQFMVSQQQAFMMREQVRQETVNTRRKIFDEYLYERERTPTPEDDRERYLKQQLARSRNNPPTTEILSGKALNDLLADIQKLAGKEGASLRTFDVPLDEENLKRVNVSPSDGRGNIGLLKNEGKLTWPVALSGAEFKEQRERLNSLCQEAVKQAEFNNAVDAGTIRQMIDDVSAVQKELVRTGRELPPSQYIEAKTFLNNLDSSVSALQQRDVGNYFTGKYSLKGKTIPQVVKYMTEQGLRFAPSVPGEEASYLAIYQALVNYDLAAQPAMAEQR